MSDLVHRTDIDRVLAEARAEQARLQLQLTALRNRLHASGEDREHLDAAARERWRASTVDAATTLRRIEDEAGRTIASLTARAASDADAIVAAARRDAQEWGPEGDDAGWS